MKLRLRREAIPALAAIAAFVVGALTTPYFLDARYLLDTSTLYVECGLLALGMTFVIVSGNIDLSVASTMALAACVVAKVLASGLPIPFAIMVGLGLGAGLGTLNGLLVAYLRLPSFVVTLASMAAYRGIAQVMVGAQSERLPSAFVGIDLAKVPGTPVPVPLALLILGALVAGIVFHRTVFGRWVQAVGTNERAAFASGVPTARVKAAVFALSGAIAGLCGLLIDSRLGVARYDHARGLELDVITAVVLGGVAITGGVGTIVGPLLALLAIALLRTEMGVANVTAEYQLAAVGTLLIVAIVFGNLVETWAASRESRKDGPEEIAT